jgi:hypothetical protein
MNDDLKFTAAEWHRQQAVDPFNFTWTLIDKPDRTSPDNDMMIHSAHASRYHWQIAGDVVNYLRGDWQIAHVYTLLNLPERALHYAQLCLRQCEDNQIGDFDLAFAYEALARAQACQGNLIEAEKCYRLAEAAGHPIAEADDRELFFSDLSKPPWFGLK